MLPKWHIHDQKETNMAEEDNEIALESKGCITCGTIGVVVLILLGLFMLVAALLYRPVDYLRAAFGTVMVVVGVGFFLRTRWAWFIMGIATIGLGLVMAIGPFVWIIAAGPFTAAGYKSPFEHISPLMMWVIIFLGLATAGAGLMMIFVSLGKLKIKELPLRGGRRKS
jgi:hypothetical protein